MVNPFASAWTALSQQLPEGAGQSLPRIAQAVVDRVGQALPNAMDLAGDDQALQAAVARARHLLHKRALTAGVASLVPVPGLDWAVDAALISKLVPQINETFGLTPEQIEQMSPRQRQRVQQAINMAGSTLVGRLVTRDLVLQAAQTVGMRLTVKQAAKFAPILGQIVSGALGYGAVRILGEQHIADCVRVARGARVVVPRPPTLHETPKLVLSAPTPAISSAALAAGTRKPRST